MAEYNNRCDTIHSNSRKFTLIKSKLPKLDSHWSYQNQVVCIGIFSSSTTA